jgi:hypothetical protein
MVKVVVVGLALFLIFQGTDRPKSQQGNPSPSHRSQDSSKCDQQKVAYSRFDHTYSKRIIWQSVTHSENPPAGIQKEYSPERTKWRANVEPDTSKQGAGNTTIYFGSDANEEVWKLSVNDNLGTDFKWLSEKLVFGRIWWGRIYATELVLDLENHKFIYKEMANYGGVTEPCE